MATSRRKTHKFSMKVGNKIIERDLYKEVEGHNKEVKILCPIVEVLTDTGNYSLVIKDSSGKYHYFDYDGKYDGFSMDCNIYEN